MLTGPRSTIKRARKLRRDMSLPEVLLWQQLRQRPHGLKFRRQQPAGKYALDFACLEAKLAIEVDGISHDMGDRPERDSERDAWVAEQGFATLRIAAKDVLEDLDAVVTMIVKKCTERRPLHRPLDGPLPVPGRIFPFGPVPERSFHD